MPRWVFVKFSCSYQIKAKTWIFRESKDSFDYNKLNLECKMSSGIFTNVLLVLSRPDTGLSFMVTKKIFHSFLGGNRDRLTQCVIEFSFLIGCVFKFVMEYDFYGAARVVIWDWDKKWLFYWWLRLLLRLFWLIKK